MKKLLLLPLLVFALPTFAQLKSGQWMTGGYTDFLYSSSHQHAKSLTSDAKSTTLQASLNGGYFILDKLSVGLTGGILLSNDNQSIEGTSQTGHISSSSSDHSLGYVIGPFIKYYLLSTQKKLNIFVNLSYGYSHNRQKTETKQMIQMPGDPSNIGTPTTGGESKKKQKIDANIFSLSVGPTFFITHRTALELGLGYSYIDYMKSKNSSNNLTLSLGFEIYLMK